LSIRDPSGPGRQGLLALDDQATLQLLELLIGCFAFHLCPVSAPVTKSGIGQALLQPAFAGEQ